MHICIHLYLTNGTLTVTAFVEQIEHYFHIYAHTPTQTQYVITTHHNMIFIISIFLFTYII
jgi:hypothetical protein